VRICRTLGTGRLRNLDPFLMLDELRMPAREASAGFPDHPHRGFETCSIMLSGKMEHHDSVGNKVRPEGISLALSWSRMQCPKSLREAFLMLVIRLEYVLKERRLS